MIAWNDLPESMKNDAVKPYYDMLAKRKLMLVCKRIFDIIFSFVGSVVLLPVILILALVVVIDSPGGAFFCQTRVTQYGRVFKVFKFRTMVKNAEKIGAQVTSESDSRVTRVGSFLRKFRLDELPQIFNILIGDLSFVGVRPEVPRYVEKYTPEMFATLLLPAGVTSKTSILYKDESELLKNKDNLDEVYINEILPQKMKYNLEYIKDFSFLKDIKIMFETVIKVIKK